MKITVPAENTARRPELITGHGLGLRIQWACGDVIEL